MTTSISANVGQQQACAPMMQPEFKPSYNAVQLNLSQPTLNVPPAPAPMPATATQQWTA